MLHFTELSGTDVHFDQNNYQISIILTLYLPKSYISSSIKLTSSINFNKINLA